MIMLRPFSAAPWAFKACFAVPAKPHDELLVHDTAQTDTPMLFPAGERAFKPYKMWKGLLTFRA